MKTSYPFKMSKIILVLFAVLIVSLCINIIFNAVRISETKNEIIVFVLSIIFSAILFLFCLMVFFFSRYKFVKDNLLLKFGFLTILKIPYERISRIGKHSVTKEIFIVYAAKNKFATHMLCVNNDLGDEMVSILINKNENIEYFSGT